MLHSSEEHDGPFGLYVIFTHEIDYAFVETTTRWYEEAAIDSRDRCRS